MSEAGGPPDEELLDRFQRAAFGYFVEEFNPANGLVADTSRPGAPCSIAVVGFALSSYPVGVERGWMERGEVVSRTLATLRFFWNSEQGEEAHVTGYRGFFYHFLDMETGKRVWDSELSLIDSTLLLAGALTAAAYFDAANPEETEIRSLADALYRRVEWAWALGGEATVRQGWKPGSGYLHYGWGGYDEATILYVLGLGSPTHPLPDDTFRSWTATYQWENIYGIDVLYGGPLFVHQFSHAWIDFAGIRDAFMREKGCDYFENSRRAVLIQREYARRNPHDFAGYGADCWGLSAGDGPGRFIAGANGTGQSFFSYAARGAPFGPDDGTIAPSATLASVPFAPELVLPALRHLTTRFPGVVDQGRLPSGFNPTLAGRDGTPWVSEGYFGLDQGIIVLMIENYRSGLLWRLMRACPYIRTGLLRAGFSGGWLAGRSDGAASHAPA